MVKQENVHIFHKNQEQDLFLFGIFSLPGLMMLVSAIVVAALPSK